MADIGMDLYLAYEDGYKKGKAETEAYLLHCGDETPITNADRIRAMTDEELAEHLLRHICNWSCPPQKEYIKASCGGEKPDCEKCWLDWLKQEIDYG